MRTLFLFLAITVSVFINNSAMAIKIPDSLSLLLKSNESKSIKQQKLLRLCYDRYLNSTKYDHFAAAMVDSVVKYDLSGHRELQNFIQILILRRNFELKKANELLVKSIVIALQRSEMIFLHQFYLNQAYVQTDLGNSLAAIHCYRLARKVAEEIENPDFLISTDIGIADIYMNIGLYPQGLFYLEQAQKTYDDGKVTRSSGQTMIYVNKAEIYFKVGELDSLMRYAKLIAQAKNDVYNIGRIRKRLKYFQLMLEGRFVSAIPLINELLTTGNQYYKNHDRWQLAVCYYQSGHLDSALVHATQLVDDPQIVPSHIKIDSYKLLAQIFQKRSQVQKANHYLTLALNESKNYTQSISKIGDVASELRLDRIEANYHARNLIYQKERTILVMTVILIVLVLIAIIVSYINVRQKNRIQKLLHEATSKELAYISSHQVRRPLANIIGICELLDGQQANMKDIKHYITLVHQEAKELDNSLTEIETKLATPS